MAVVSVRVGLSIPEEKLQAVLDRERPGLALDDDARREETGSFLARYIGEEFAELLSYADPVDEYDVDLDW